MSNISVHFLFCNKRVKIDLISKIVLSCANLNAVIYFCAESSFIAIYQSGSSISGWFISISSHQCQDNTVDSSTFILIEYNSCI